MKKTIVVSAINLRSGGTLSILNDCLNYLDSVLSLEYKIIALVHDKNLCIKTKNIEYIEFPKSISSYIYRFYYEYYYFIKLSKKLQPYLWLSLHDMSPRVKATVQAVYCHNPSPFYIVNFKEFLLDKKFTIFSFLYKYIYQINISSNDYVIVQQNWLRDKFKELYNIKKCVVSYPIVKNQQHQTKIVTKEKKDRKVFFYPSFPRVFKNFELICEAVERISSQYIGEFEIILTIDGSENKYSKSIFDKYHKNKNIKFIGLQSRERVFELYDEVDCLIFPSKLETWGLPISEFKEFSKPILLANLQYSHETIGKYKDVSFFNPLDSTELVKLIENFISETIVYDGNINTLPSNPFVTNWKQLFNTLLEGIKNDSP